MLKSSKFSWAKPLLHTTRSVKHRADTVGYLMWGCHSERRLCEVRNLLLKTSRTENKTLATDSSQARNDNKLLDSQQFEQGTSEKSVAKIPIFSIHRFLYYHRR